jgi:hypothetical protein
VCLAASFWLISCRLGNDLLQRYSVDLPITHLLALNQSSDALRTSQNAQEGMFRV